jgi:hypothetical protein
MHLSLDPAPNSIPPVHPGAEDAETVDQAQRLAGEPHEPLQMTATKVGISMNHGADGQRAGNTDLTEAGSGQKSDQIGATFGAPVPADAQSAFYRCRGFRPLELRDVGAVNALIQTERRRKRRVQWWWLVISLATLSSVALAGCMAWVAT